MSTPNYISFFSQNRTAEQAEAIYKQRIADALLIHEKFSPGFYERACPCCGETLPMPIEKFKETYGVAKCGVCATLYVTPCPPSEALEYYYNNCRCNAMLGELLKARHKSRNNIASERIQFIIELISEHLADRECINILEVGCNSGALLSELKDALNDAGLLGRCKLSGIDIDRNAIAENVDSDIDLRACSIEDYSTCCDETFDLIIHFELIEHLPDPYGFMLAARKMLSPGGIHHFHTPNALGMDNQALGYNDFRALAHGIFPPMHLQAFTPQNIVHFSIRTGYKIVQVDTPGNFDIDIVSNWISKNDASSFSLIHNLSKEHLAIFQEWLKLLCASSHMRCTIKN